MENEFNNIKLALMNVLDVFNLEIKEDRQSSTTYSVGDPPVRKTETFFNWKLRGLMSKINPKDYPKEDKSWINKQKLQRIEIKSDYYDWGFGGYVTREKAIEEALEFAKDHGIKVDGYTHEHTSET